MLAYVTGDVEGCGGMWGDVGDVKGCGGMWRDVGDMEGGDIQYLKWDTDIEKQIPQCLECPSEASVSLSLCSCASVQACVYASWPVSV